MQTVWILLSNMSSIRESENVTVSSNLYLTDTIENGVSNSCILGLPMNICRKDPNLVKIGQEYRTLYWRLKYFLLLPATSNCHRSDLFEWNYIKLLGGPRRYQHYANSPVLRDAYKLCSDPAARARTANERNNGLAENGV